MSDPSNPNGSSLCLACGLCCQGVLHNHAVIAPDEIENVRSLGLTVEPHGDHLGFRLPCPLYQDNCCSIYAAKRPQVCGAYRCALLKKYLAYEITLEQSVQTVQRAKDLYADVLKQLPAGYSFSRLKKEMQQDWDSGRGLVGSSESRQANAQLFLAMAKLTRYLHKHFEKQKARKIE